MDRWYWMYIRAYAPASGLILAAVVIAMALARLQAHPIFDGLVSIVRWLPLALLAGAVLHMAWVTYRLWQAHHGNGRLCECGGLLGGEHDGRADRAGAYRRCYACGKNVNNRYYE